jgi:8-oxo-dGTP pyrophosphatase MutT (NUDIX family)
VVISTVNEAVGVWFFAQNTQRYLYLLRSDIKNPERWGLPGGKVEKDESLLDGIERECTEEMGSMPLYTKLIPIEKFTSPNNNFYYHTFFCLLDAEFIPVLNHEHIGYTWINKGIIPKPLHPGLWATLKIDEIYQRIKTVEELYS